MIDAEVGRQHRNVSGCRPEATNVPLGTSRASFLTTETAGFGTGNRMPIKATRGLLTAALDGSLADATFRKDSNFGFQVPVDVDGVPSILLDPRRTWSDTAAYDRQAAKLVKMFSGNFEQYLPFIAKDVRAVAIG